MNESINVVVLDFDDNKKRISLGLKQLQEHPWTAFVDTVNVGDKVKGVRSLMLRITEPSLEIQPVSVEGLIHVSEVSWSSEQINSRKFFKMGEEHEAIIMTVGAEERKMSLSIKRLVLDPWEVVAERYAVDSKHTKSETLHLMVYLLSSKRELVVWSTFLTSLGRSVSTTHLSM